MKEMTVEQIASILSSLAGVKENEPMDTHTSFRVGGPARLYFVANSSDEILHAMKVADEVGATWSIFGGGSNLLVSDEGYNGLLIQAANRNVDISGNIIKAEAGAITAMVSRKSVEDGLTGFEWASGIPGTMGGAVFGNSGCFGGEMKDAVTKVDAYNISKGERVLLSNEECAFGYRDSIFKHEPHVILGCELKLDESPDVEESKRRMMDVIEKRKESQPLGKSSCGCIFKNYDFQDASELEILKRQIDEIPEVMLTNKRLAAGWLVDQVGMRGQRIGNIQVSEKHGNFFENHEKARAQDIIALISLVKMKVRDELGIELHEEVQLLGFE